VTEPISVLVVEDDPLMRDGLVAILREADGLRVVGAVGTVIEAALAARSLHPHVVLMDFRLPDGDGADATRRIREEQPDVAVVFLSIDVSDDAMMLAVGAGACGYISKTASADEVVRAVFRAGEGEFLLSPRTMARLRRREHDQEDSRGSALSADERRVLALLAQHRDNNAIADDLAVQYSSVRVHVQSLLRKLGVTTKEAAVAKGRDLGLLPI
jgi:DNA-binding NarL/FixJ family response regulator